MKKFFLIPLVALFTCVNVWADPIARIVGGGQGERTADNLTELNGILEDLNETSAIVTLLSDIEGEKGVGDLNNVTVIIPENKDVTLNLAGHGIVQNWEVTEPVRIIEWADGVDGDATLASYELPSNYTAEQAYNEKWPFPPFSYAVPRDKFKVTTLGGDIEENAIIYNLGTLKIISEGSSIVQMITLGSDAGQATTICNAGNLTVEGGVFIGPTPYVVNGTVKMPALFNKTIDGKPTPTVNISGGVFLCDERESDYQWGSYWPSVCGTADWTITGGIFSEDEQVVKLKHPSTLNFINENNIVKEDYEAVLVPYSNSNIKGYNIKDRKNYRHGVGTGSNQYLDTIKNVIVVRPKVTTTDINSANDLAAASVDVNSDIEMTTGVKKAKFVYVADGKKLTIPNGATLHVGANGLALGGKESQVIVEPGGVLIADNDIITNNHRSVVLTMDEVNRTYSNLLIKAEKIQGSHPNATVKLISKAKGEGAVWQRFAVPTYAEDFMLDSIKYDKDTYPTAFFQWGADAWEVIMPSAKATTAADPFRGYAMTTSNANAGAEYTFKCELVGNGNPSLDINAGWNYYANAYTAPMNIKAWLTDLMDEASLDEENTVNAAVYVQNKSSNRWKSYAYADVENNRISETAALEPMQAFVYYAKALGKNSLKYTDYVYTPFMDQHPSFAPRRAAREVDYAEAEIILTDQNGDEDVIALYEGEQFSTEFDDGYDVYKLMDDPNFYYIYLVSPLGNLERLASDDINNAAISVITPEAGEFTFSFANVSLENCFLVDVETETKTEIKEGNTYVFTAEANGDYSGRFVIVKDGGEGPSAIDNVETKHIANGIYSITGIYMGTNLETLPAGIYVVNGKKVVK